MSTLPQIKDLRSLLEKFYDKSVVVLSSDSKLLTAPGENYGGVMLAVEAIIKIENSPPELKKIVAKMCPANEMLCEVFNIQESFQKEMAMYTDAIPALANFENEYDITDDKIEDMFAACYGGRINLKPGSLIVDKDAVLLLENLKMSGYEMADRLTGFDKEHAETIIKNLAKFHAGPVAMNILKPDIFAQKVRPCLKGINLGDGFEQKAIDFMISEVTDVLETKKECLPYIQKLIDSMNYSLTGPYRLNIVDSLFSSISHTDYWVNNTMILYDDQGKPIHNKIVDLQLTMYNSVVHDLLFFLYSSISSSLLLPNIDHFLKLYYDTFIERLKKFDIDISPFSWKTFTQEISKIGPLEIGHILFMFKPILTKRGAINDMSEFGDDQMYRKDIVSKDYETRIIETVLSFIERKWI